MKGTIKQPKKRMIELTNTTMEHTAKWIEEHKQETIRAYKALLESPVKIEIPVLSDLVAHTGEDITEINKFVNFAIVHTMNSIENGDFGE